MRPSVALLSSPLLGPATWEPVSRLLRARGCNAFICAPTGAVRSPEDVLDGYLAQLPAHEPTVLVPHSNAGAYVPALAARRSAVAAVFVDAVLPPERGQLALSEPAFLEFLRTKVDSDGQLPVWTQWWDDDDIPPLFPDAASRTRVTAEQPRIPLSYFQSTMPLPAHWSAIPGAYLAFGESYARERDDAQGRGWPVLTLPGSHLHQLVRPDEVASALEELLDRLAVSPAKRRVRTDP